MGPSRNQTDPFRKSAPLILGVVILILVFFVFKKRTETGTFLPTTIGEDDIKNGRLSGAKNDILQLDTATLGKLSPAQIVELEKKQKEMTLAPRARSDAEVKSFLKDTSLSLPMPTDLTYSRLDLDDNMAAVYGASRDKKVGMTMLGYPAQVSPEVAIRYFVESTDAIPNTKGKKIVSLGKPTSLAVKQGSGLGQITWVEGRASDGQAVHLAIIARADKKGTYMMVFSGPPSYFDENEGFFDKMHNEIKAEPR